MPPRAELIAAALAFTGAGCSVVPARADGTKAPAGLWRTYQTQRATVADVTNWLTSGLYDGIGLVTGAVSGNLEMLEFEGRAITDGLHDQVADIAEASGLGDLWKKITNGYAEQTPSGGIHYLYRVNGTVAGNTKLARRPATPDELDVNADDKVKVLIETRGEGGYVITAPSNGRTHPTGQPWTMLVGDPGSIPTITADERDALHILAHAVDAMPAPEPAPAKQRENMPRNMPGDGPGVADDYNAKTTWTDLLTPHGWVHVFTAGGTSYWRRPGKNDGISASTGRNDGDNLYVFSTSTEFHAEKPYSRFAAYAVLEHAGDLSAAAKHLYRTGYGQQRGADDDPFADLPTTASPAVVPGDGHRYDQFWEARPILTHLRTYARARLVSPWSVLGVTLVRIAAAVPPFVVLPDIVGSHGSLNTFVGLIGPSGSGKDAATAAAVDALDVGHILTIGAGSGEGIAHQFASYKRPNPKTSEPGGVEQHTKSVIMTAAEVDTLAALRGRQGSTLMPELRKAWTGSDLGFAYVEKEKRITLPAHSYRLGFIVGIQPEKAAPLLDDADGGTPQRFLWMPATDPDAPDTPPDAPEPLLWRHPRPWPTAGVHGRVVLGVCDTARRTIIDARLARLRGAEPDGDESLDGHALLARLKVAALLALLDDRTDVTDEDWHLAGVIAAKSTATRNAVVGALGAARKAENAARGVAAADRELIVEDAKDERVIRRVARRVLLHLGDEGVPHNEARKKVAARDRGYFDDAIIRLIDAGQIHVEETSGGRVYRRVDGASK